MAKARDRLTHATPKQVKADICTDNMNSNLKVFIGDLTALSKTTFTPYEADVYLIDAGGVSSPVVALAASGTFPDGYLVFVVNTGGEDISFAGITVATTKNAIIIYNGSAWETLVILP
jgi:hypothetical protein